MRPTKLIPPSEGPYQVVKFYNNGKVKIQRGGYCERILITMIEPFFAKEQQE